MAWYDNFINKRIDEAIKNFENKGKDLRARTENLGGEGIDELAFLQGYGQVSTLTLNKFYNRYINRIYENEVAKIMNYRSIAQAPEVADIIEDAVNESTQRDEADDNTFILDIKDEKLSNNDNIKAVLYKEFNDLFYNRIDINNKIWDMVRTFFIDGRLYYERIIDEKKAKEGIKNIKKLPAETMDMEIDPKTGNILTFYQYLVLGIVRPQDKKAAEREKDKIIVFNPAQIGYINTGIYGSSKYDVLGYLEKAKVPYNQLKLLETSVIIYRIVRSPERLVFKIDTGNMPRDKAMKFVEKIKTKFVKKQSYDPTTGNLTNEPEVLSILENFFLPTSSDGRGSSIETVGGDAKGFTELDDIYYFAKKLYRALKYPISRVEQQNEGQSANIVFGGSNAGQITRDEIKWAKFLERQQSIFCNEFRDLFLLHLDFKGLKQQYSLSQTSFEIKMTPPSHYRKSMEQAFLEASFNNYNALSNNMEFSKYYLIKRYLKWTDEDLKQNKKGFKLDKKYGLTSNENFENAAGGGEQPGSEGEEASIDDLMSLADTGGEEV